MAITRGSPNSPPMASFVSAKVSEEAAAAQPPSAMAQSTDGLGARGTFVSVIWASAEVAMPLAPLTRGWRQAWTELLKWERSCDSGATDTDEKEASATRILLRRWAAKSA